MLRKLAVYSMILIASSIVAFAQSAHTPGKGSPERKAILDALRVPVEKELKQKIVFVTDNFKVQGTWAFVSGTPQMPDGSRPDYRKTIYWEAVKSDAFDNNVFALLRRTAGTWRVVTKAIGCTDVCYADWWRTHKAPKAIFPYTE
jgi:hypothetical protein